MTTGSFTPSRLLVHLLFTIALMNVARVDAQAHSVTYDLNIPRQQLDNALRDLAQQTGLQVGRFSDAANGNIVVGPLAGKYSAQQALEALLAKSGLAFRPLNDRAYIILAPEELSQQSVTRTIQIDMANHPDETIHFSADGAAVEPKRNSMRIAQASMERQGARAPGDATAASPEDEAAAREEVIVTGRRDSHLAVFGNVGTRQIPLAIQVIGSADIAAANATSLEKILLTDPAYTANYGSSSLSSGVTNGFLRGFYVSRYMANGVPQNFSWNITPAEVTERVEVLRGPSAFSYGFMSPGGAINIVSKAPPDSTELLTLRSSIDEHGKTMLHADAGGRLGAGDAVGYRINLAAAEGDTFLSNTEQSRRVAGLALDYRVSDRTVLSLSTDYIDAKTHGEIEGNRRVFDIDGNLLQGLGQEVPISAPHHFLKNKISTVGVQLATSVTENIDLTSKIFYSDYREEYFNIYDLGDLDAQGVGTIEQAFGSYFVDDLNFTTFLTGRFGSGRVRHRLTMGVSAGDSEYTAKYAGEIFTGRWFEVESFMPPTYTKPDLPYSVQKVKEYGAFVSDIIEVNDVWRLLLGVRWSEQEVNNRDPSSGIKDPEMTAHKITPLLGAMYDITPQLSVYANYATGLERGGRAPLDASNPNELMPPLVSKQYEMGVKWQLAGGRAALDMAVFQITQPSEFYQGPGTQYVQDGEQRNRGAEVVLRGKVSDSLRLTGGVQYLDAEIINTDDVAAVGSSPWGVPQWQGALSADLDIGTVPGLSLIGLVTGRSERQLVVPNDRRTGPGYVLFDLGARYEFDLSGKEMVAQIRMENVADKEYAAGSGSLFGVPRTLWLSVELKLL